jgi:predicted MPP superfamily phosphohydrolase
MKILLLSDLHREFGKIRIDSGEADVVVLAGDISVGSEGIVWAANEFKVPVIYVAGNHEFYSKKRTHQKHIENLRKRAEGTNVHFLENDTITIDDVKFIGATLWTDYGLFGKPYLSGTVAARGLNDFENITIGVNQRLTTDYIMGVNSDSKMFIQEELNKPFDGKVIVVTHHAPSIHSCLDRYKHDELTPAYASRLEHMMLYSPRNPDYWFHGHMHNTSDYVIGECRVVVNPRGYHPFAVNDDFEYKIIDTSKRHPQFEDQ